MLTTLRDMDPKRAEATLSKLMRTLLPDAGPRSQTEQFQSLTPLEHSILQEIGERLGFVGDLPSKAEVPAALDFLSRELSEVVLSKANVDELESRAFHSAPATRAIRPRVFISSSEEGLDYANTLRRLLEPSANAIVWADQISVAGRWVDSLIRELARFDFAVFILTNDDLEAFRGKSSPARSNIMFEAGLFVGRLGVDRTFFVSPRRQAFFRDLAGIVTLEYDADAPSREQALVYTSHRIVSAIQQFGPVGSKVAVNT